MNSPYQTLRSAAEEDFGIRQRGVAWHEDYGLDLQESSSWVPPVDHGDFRRRALQSIHDDGADAHSILDGLCQSVNNLSSLPEAYFHVLTRLLDRGVHESVARDLIHDVHEVASPADMVDANRLWSLLAKQVKSSIHVAGAIPVQPGVQRVVAFVGPTGVGKTTTIAKLAGNMRLRERHRVGLITVDTYRIAAVDQLKAYAEIIDLPMETVSTPQEMRNAVAMLSDQDVVLIDTAGRSPQNEVQIQELKVMLSEANTHETHLVLSSVASSSNLSNTCRRFQHVGITSAILTKLDESETLCDLIPFFREERIPVSYLTDGQSVPDDIQIAQRSTLADGLLGESR
ncbi:MAG: 50S ribosome-binding GTPase [Planctomycetales bacterium]|nr:50S ribosome-binding GTPase [Planctomycetales bacterium]